MGGQGKFYGTKLDTSSMIPQLDHAARPQVHMIIVAIDYKGTGNELTCTKDGNNMRALAEICGVTNVYPLYDNHGNFGEVANAIRQVGGNCSRGDFFIFYYSGHGSRV